VGRGVSFTERALTFDCHGETLVGVVSQPAEPTRRGVVIVVGGPQYRAGSHRQFVVTARALAEAGLAVLRFDVRGMGDATGALRDFEGIDDDIGAAIHALQKAVPSVEQVVLLGLCDGASASLMHVDAHRDDARIAGLVLINPWVRSAQTLAKAHVKHYYLQRLREGAFWRKLLRGQVAWAALRGLVSSLSMALRPADKADAGDRRSFQQRMADGWIATSAPIWLVLSGNDYTAKEFIAAWDSDPIWRAAHARPGVLRSDMEQADHTFSSSVDQRSLDRWLRQALARPH
jgi:exosortase A-associated hydrolase 1